MKCVNCGKELEKPAGVCSPECLKGAMDYDRNLNERGREFADKEHYKTYAKVIVKEAR